MQSVDHKYRADIDGLRAIAVLTVVVFHIHSSLVPGGYVGVDIFFVISGYLIGGILLRDLEKKTFSIRTFYERRVRRIFPALFATLLVTLGIAAAIYMPLDFRNFSGSLTASVLFSSNIFFWWNTGYFDQTSELKPLLHTWSLGVEEQYYLLFPIILFLLFRFARRWLLAALFVMAAISLAISVYQVEKAPDAAFYLPFGRLWELLVGAILAIGHWPRLKSAALRDGVMVVGMASIVVSLFVFTPETPFPGFAALLPTIGAGLLIYGGGDGQSAMRTAMSNPVSVFFGKISYSLYLVHWPVMAFFRYLSSREPTVVEAVALFVVMILLAWVMWKFVETPFRAGGGQRISDRAILVAAIPLAVFLVGVGALGYTQRGLPGRLPDRVRDVAMAAYDTNPMSKDCDRRSLKAVRDGDFCIRGAEGDVAPSVVLLGDSFGNALAPGVVEAMAQSGQRGAVLTYSGCIPLIGVEQENAVCRKFMDEAAAAIDRDPDFKTIVIIARWTGFYEGSRFGEEVESGWFITDEQSAGASYSENRRVFARALSRTLERFKGRKVVIVAGLPEQDRNVPRVLGVAAQFNRPAYRGVTREVFDQRQQSVNAAIAETSAGRALVLDLSQKLCDAARCRVSQDGMSLYSDDNHISREGALWLMPEFRNVLVDSPPAAAPKQDGG